MHPLPKKVGMKPQKPPEVQLLPKMPNYHCQLSSSKLWGTAMNGLYWSGQWSLTSLWIRTLLLDFTLLAHEALMTLARACYQQCGISGGGGFGSGLQTLNLNGNPTLRVSIASSTTNTHSCHLAVSMIWGLEWGNHHVHCSTLLRSNPLHPSQRSKYIDLGESTKTFLR